MINSPVRYQPNAGFTRLPDMIDQLFRESFVAPTRFERFFDKRLCNLLETPTTYVMQLALPGVVFDKLHVNVVGRQLTINAWIAVPKIEDATYLWNGLFEEEFTEVFTLPMEVVGEKALATYEYGILNITLPKVEYALPKEIKVTGTK
jgi:HSP20 family protein